MNDQNNNALPDEEDILVTLEMDDGTTIECAILTIFEVSSQDYIALLPLDEKGEPNAEGTIYLYRYLEDEDGNPSLEDITDENEYEAVEERFDELLDEAEFEGD